MSKRSAVNDGLFGRYDGLLLPRTANAKIARSAKRLTKACNLRRFGHEARARPKEIAQRAAKFMWLCKAWPMLNRATQQAVRDCLLEYFAYKGYGIAESEFRVSEQIAFGVGPNKWSGINADFGLPVVAFCPSKPEDGLTVTNPDAVAGMRALPDAHQQYRSFVEDAVRYRRMIIDGVCTQAKAVDDMRAIHDELWDSFQGFFK